MKNRVSMRALLIVAAAIIVALLTAVTFRFPRSTIRETQSANWIIQVEKGVKNPGTVVCVLRRGGIAGVNDGFAIWRTGTEVYSCRLRGALPAWGRPAVIHVDLLQGIPQSEDLLNSIISTVREFDDLPNSEPGAEDDLEYYIYVRKEGVEHSVVTWDGIAATAPGYAEFVRYYTELSASGA